MPAPPAFRTKRFSSGPIRSATYRAKYEEELLDIDSWKRDFRRLKLPLQGHLPEVSFYTTKTGRKVVVRKVPPAKEFFSYLFERVMRKRELGLPPMFPKRNLTKTMGELLKKKVPFERPLATFKDWQGREYHVSEQVNGPLLGDITRSPFVGGEERERAVGLALKTLRKLHDAGLTHGHPHSGNIVIENGRRAVLLDAKYIGAHSFHRVIRNLYLRPIGLKGTAENRQLVDVAMLLRSAAKDNIPRERQEALVLEHYLKRLPREEQERRLSVLRRISARPV